MSGTVLVASLGIVAVILLFLYWKLSEENSGTRYPLQVMLFAFLLGVVILLGKVSVDYEDNCAWLVSNSTTSGSSTSYNYTYECSENPNTTAGTFYGVTVWLARIVMIYLFLTFAFEAINFFAWKKKGGGR